MDEQVLRETGLTEGEIRVYKALIKIGKSSTGPIMKESKISSSKVYLILDKLIKKGLASYIIENNVKRFSPTNPDNIIHYLEKKKKNIEKTESKAKDLVAEIKIELGAHEREQARIYKGFPGLRTAFKNILNELEEGKEFLFFSVTKEEFTDRVKLFLTQIHNLRAEKNIISKGIFDKRFKKRFEELKEQRRLYRMKFADITLPSSMTIGKNRILLTRWEEPIGFEILSKGMAQDYREFFHKIWDD